ncbi:MAG: hypothetical protein BGP06_16065 [Rhizobiales bacterium 65-9]|nr:YcgN family cysteine cluster protein [Hyphomicrobiales bacterium]OJY37984.1 MAG: hypothetical protein BGP06_16065 [Rhizobiales bacterium 65-9]
MPRSRPSVAPSRASAKARPFWLDKTLEDMTEQEWESLCDGCARCCLIKLEDEDTGKILHTDIGCKLLDGETCRCKDYPRRSTRVPDCVTLTPEAVRALTWLPPTCAYRLVAEGKDLFDWHPLKTGDSGSVHRAGVSVKGRVHCSEKELPVARWHERIKRWPNMTPKGRRP